MTQIAENYISTGKVVYIFENFPLPATTHPQAQVAAEAVECAGLQGKFWAMHDQVFLNQAEWSGQENALDVLLGYGAKLGLDDTVYRTCLSEHQTAQKVGDDLLYGLSIGIDATPTFLINGQVLVGAYPFETFRQVIEEELAP